VVTAQVVLLARRDWLRREEWIELFSERAASARTGSGLRRRCGKSEAAEPKQPPRLNSMRI